MEPSFNDSSVSFHETVSIRNFRGKHIANHHLCDLCHSCHSGNSSSYFLLQCFLRKHKLSVLFMKEVNQDGLEKTNIKIMFNMPQPKNLKKVATVLWDDCWCWEDWPMLPCLNLKIKCQICEKFFYFLQMGIYLHQWKPIVMQPLGLRYFFDETGNQRYMGKRAIFIMRAAAQHHLKSRGYPTLNREDDKFFLKKIAQFELGEFRDPSVTTLSPTEGTCHQVPVVIHF